MSAIHCTSQPPRLDLLSLLALVKDKVQRKAKNQQRLVKWANDDKKQNFLGNGTLGYILVF